MTIVVTCSLPASPCPVTAALTSEGVCRPTGTPARAAAAIATPAAWAVPSTVGVFVFANMRSTAARSGRCATRTAETASSMRRSR